MKLVEFLDKDVFVEDQKIGQVKDVYFDPENWQITHLKVQLTKEAAHDILGAKMSMHNMLAISALEKGVARWTDAGLHLRVSKDQLHIYLRPVD